MKTIFKKALIVLLATGLATQSTPVKADNWGNRIICVGVLAALWQIEGIVHEKLVNMQQSTKIAATVRELYTKEIRMVADAAKNGTLVDTARFVKMQDYDKIKTLFHGLPLCFKSGSPIGAYELSENMAKICELYHAHLERNLSKKELRSLAKKVDECNAIIATFTKSKFNLATFHTVAHDIVEKREAVKVAAPEQPKVETIKLPGKEMVPGIAIAAEGNAYKIRIAGSATLTNDKNKRTYVCSNAKLTIATTENSFAIEALSATAQTKFELDGVLVTTITEEQLDGITTITLNFEQR